LQCIAELINETIFLFKNVILFILNYLILFFSFPLSIIISPIFYFYYKIYNEYYVYKTNNEKLINKGINYIIIIVKTNFSSYINESIEGVVTIRSLKQEEYTINNLNNLLLKYENTLYLEKILTSWIDSKKTLYKSIIDFFTIFILLLKSNTISSNTFSYLITLVGTYTWNISEILENFGQVQKNYYKIESSLEYLKLKNENDETLKKVDTIWPKFGKIEFKNVFMKYQTSKEYIIKGVSFIINPKEKIGIVGRTGFY
jgi:ABC-type multidrug transport system fused ATPase/permease subunit